jgi:hypothetical protein
MPRRSLRSLGAAALGFAGAAAFVGCADLLGFQDYSASTSAGGASSAASSSVASTGGTGGAACQPGTTEPCYSGPPATQDVGACKAGVSVCGVDGKLGACVGEILPAASEDCGADGDEDCNGAADLADPACACPVNQETCAQALRWAQRFGDDADQVSGSVAVDVDDDVIVTGRFQSTLNFGNKTLTSAGGNDAFVAKLDRDGFYQWDLSFGDGNFQNVLAVAVDGTKNVFIGAQVAGSFAFGGKTYPIVPPDGGGTPKNVFVAKIDPNGGQGWGAMFVDATGDDTPNSVAADAAGDVLVTGAFKGSVDFGGGTRALGGALSRGFVLKLGGVNGDYLWDKDFGFSGSEQRGDGVAVDTSNNDDVFVIGTFGGTLDGFGSPSTAKGGTDVFVAKLSSGGGLEWKRDFGSTDDDSGVAVAVGSDGNPIVAATIRGDLVLGNNCPLPPAGGGNDILVAKLRWTDGECVWSHRYGGADDQTPTGLSVDGQGNVFLTGKFAGTITFVDGGTLTAVPHDAGLDATDTLVAKLDPAGNHLWSQRFGDSRTQNSTGIAAGTDGAVVLGYFRGVMNFGAVSLKSAGDPNYDIFVAKLAP